MNDFKKRSILSTQKKYSWVLEIACVAVHTKIKIRKPTPDISGVDVSQLITYFQSIEAYAPLTFSNETSLNCTQNALQHRSTKWADYLWNKNITFEIFSQWFDYFVFSTSGRFNFICSYSRYKCWWWNETESSHKREKQWLLINNRLYIFKSHSRNQLEKFTHSYRSLCVF